MRLPFASIAALLLTLHSASGAASAGPFIEDMTWVEVRDAQRAGKTTMCHSTPIPWV